MIPYARFDEEQCDRSTTFSSVPLRKLAHAIYRAFLKLKKKLEISLVKV